MPREYLSDSSSVNYLIRKIAAERNWSKTDIDNDITILERNRLFYVGDLKALSKESWAEIELLPLVKDLLRNAIGPDWVANQTIEMEDDSNTEVLEEIKEEPAFVVKEKKKKSKDDVTKKKKKSKDDDTKEKKKKKEKKDKGFKSMSTLGTPVVPTILTRPHAIITQPPVPTHLSESNVNDTNNNNSNNVFSDSYSQDSLTIENTIRNGTTLDLTMASMHIDPATDTEEDEEEDDDDLMSPGGTKKSVSFSNETSIGVAASEKSKIPVKAEKKEKKKEKEKKEKKKEKKKNKAMASMNNKIQENENEAL
ncbi:hypothetical protein BDB01DRAFT_787908 [Pilobolus umbonatus]|nr:hypothetical protein BDB01DRAFT_787908 [Pilobolus umbonatus]